MPQHAAALRLGGWPANWIGFYIDGTLIMDPSKSGTAWTGEMQSLSEIVLKIHFKPRSVNSYYPQPQAWGRTNY
jgi:hypothetical protein